MAPTERSAVPGLAGGAGGGTRRRRVLGLPVDALTLEECVGEVDAAIHADRRCRILVTNANKAWLASRDARLREQLERAELVIPEWATVWAAGVLGVGPLSYYGGLLLMRRLLSEAAARAWSCWFVGAQPNVVAKLVTRLRGELPALRIGGWHHGYLDAAQAVQLRNELCAHRPDLLFVAMGSPAQEYWLGELPESAARVTLGVGGSFDVLAGVKRDTPSWMRGRGLEWIYRTWQDPRHYGPRYLRINPWFVTQVVRERLVGRPPEARA